MTEVLEQLFQAWQNDASLRRNFARRCELAEQLDAALLGRDISSRQQLTAAKIQAQLEAADTRFFSRVRERLRNRHYNAPSFVQALARHATRKDDFEGYAPLDVLLAGLFDAGELPEEQARDPEMVAYQPAPGRIILSLLQQVSPTDIFYDIGSGLGRVVIAVALFTGAQAKSIENQPSFCAYAARVAADLNVPNAAFIAKDAREADIEDGNIFFLYTPFRGEMLKTMLQKLRARAANSSIRLCTFGPCSAEVALEPWLTLSTGSTNPSDLTVFTSST